MKRLGIILAALIPVAVIGAFVMKKGSDSPATSASTTTTITPTSSAFATAVASGTAASGTAASVTIQPPPSTTASAAATTTAAEPATSVYADGTYTATGNYTSPEGPESVTVTLTIANHIVTKTSLVANAKAGTPSSMWQEKFASGYETLVVGKNLAELKLTKVSGSSLTPIGFNAAVADIQTQAQS